MKGGEERAGDGSPRSRNWWERPVRVLQFNIEDRYGVFVPKIRGYELARLAKRVGANVLVIFARDPWGRVHYRGSKVGPEHPKMVGDIVREALEEGRRLGVKVVVMVGHTANKHLFEKHKDWAQVNKNGEVIILEHVPAGMDPKRYEPEWPQMCINSPFFDHVKKEVEEVLDIGVDGVFLDSFRYQPDIERACYCKWCRRKFKEDTGYEMPTEMDGWDSVWKTLWEWRYRVVKEKISELGEQVKKRAPGTLFMYNSHPGGWAGRTNKIVEISRDHIDVVFAECSEVDHQPPGFVTEMVKLTRAMAGGKPVWASRNYFHLYRTTQSTTPLAIRQGLREAIVGGGSPWLLIFSISYFQDPKALRAAEEVFREHMILEEYLDGAEPIRYAAIIASNKTRDHYGRERPQHYVDEVRGFYYALTHSHLPVEYIADRDIEDPANLRGYSVIIAANTACMTDAAISAVEEFVKEGGGLVATYLTSTRGEGCVRRYEIGLRKVLGIERTGMLRHSWTYIKPVEEAHPIFDGVLKEMILWGDMSYEFVRLRVAPMLGYHTVVQPAEGSPTEVLARIVLPGGRFGYEYTLGRSPPPASSETEAPAITTSKYGVGSSVYFSGQLGRHYWRTGLPEYLGLIRNSVTYVAGDPPALLEGPSTVHAGYFRQGERTIIHIINHSYNQRILATSIGSVMQPLPPYSTAEAVHPPREIIPVGEVTAKVLIDEPEKMRAYLPLRGNKEIETFVSGGYVAAKVGVREYEVVVFEPKA